MSGTKSDPQDEVLPLGKLKQVLALAEKKPLGCAFGLTKDKKECLLLIDKSAKPKKAATLLKKDAKDFLDVGTMRFGRVVIDVANDPTTLRFTVNRSEAGGTLVSMNRLAKKAGYQGIVINTSDALEDESEEGEESETIEGGIPTPPPQQSAPDPSGLKAPNLSPPIDAAALKARLTLLVKQMLERIAADPASKDELSALAKHASLMLGTNNLKSATEDADRLEQLLNAPMPVAPTSGEPPKDKPTAGVSDVAVEKSHEVWGAVRTKVSGEIEKLRAAVVNTYLAEGIGGDIDVAYRSLTSGINEKVTKDEFGKKLLEIQKETDPAKRAKLLGEATMLLDDVTTFFGSNDVIAKLEDNPFVPVAIGATVAGAAAMLKKSLTVGKTPSPVG